MQNPVDSRSESLGQRRQVAYALGTKLLCYDIKCWRSSSCWTCKGMLSRKFLGKKLVKNMDAGEDEGEDIIILIIITWVNLFLI